MSATQLKWGHLNINVTNLDQSVTFYERLGFRELLPAIPYLGISRQGGKLTGAMAQALGLSTDTVARGCIMELDHHFPKLDLMEVAMTGSAEPLQTRDRGLVRLCLGTENLQNEYLRLQELGVPFLTPPASADNGMADVAVCQDPDGTLIELIQIYPEKW